MTPFNEKMASKLKETAVCQSEIRRCNTTWQPDWASVLHWSSGERVKVDGSQKEHLISNLNSRMLTATITTLTFLMLIMLIMTNMYLCGSAQPNLNSWGNWLRSVDNFYLLNQKEPINGSSLLPRTEELSLRWRTDVRSKSRHKNLAMKKNKSVDNWDAMQYEADEKQWILLPICNYSLHWTFT